MTTTAHPSPGDMPKGAELPRSPVFFTTHWSMVLSASSRNDAAGAHAALGSLCKAYWYPLYAYVRRRGYSAEDAKDLTQEFFARLLERDGVAGVTPEKGRFRSFLLASMNHFLADEWDKARAEKRGGPAAISWIGKLRKRSLENLAKCERPARRQNVRRHSNNALNHLTCGVKLLSLLQ